MMSKKQYRHYEIEQVDENGEVRSIHREASYIIDDGPNYIRLYLDEVLSTLYDLPLSCSTVLFGLLKKVSYVTSENTDDSMVVYINSSLKQDILDKSAAISSVKTITNSLNLMVKKGILYRVNRAKYQLNPWLFGKGKWTDIQELRLTHIWNNFGHTIVTEAKRKKKIPINLSPEDKEIYAKYSTLQKIAEEKEITLEQLLKQLELSDPPNWWKLMT